MNMQVNTDNAIYSLSLQGLDIESALMAVQSKRAELLESQLKGQLEEVQARNQQIAKLNNALSDARIVQSKFGSGDKPSSSIKDKTYKDLENVTKDILKKPNVENMGINEDTLNAEFKKYRAENPKAPGLKVIAHGIDNALQPYKDELLAVFQGTKKLDEVSQPVKELFNKETELQEKYNAAKEKAAPYENLKSSWEAAGLSGFESVKNKGDLDTQIENIKSLIDSLSNSQQMDMLRLQSLSNKRNEAFDLMTNFVKKMQDNRSSVIGNMR